MLIALRALILAHGKLHILWNINHHRTRTAIGSNIKGFMQNARQILNRTHKIIVLCAMTRDTNRIAFLERV